VVARTDADATTADVQESRTRPVHAPRRQAGFRERPRWPPAAGASQARTDPQPAERRGRASDGAQNRPPRATTPSRTSTEGTGRRIGDFWREVGTGQVRPSSPAAPCTEGRQRQVRSFSPAGHVQVAPTRNGQPQRAPRSTPVGRSQNRRRSQPVCISWCPRGDTLHTHTATSRLSGLRDSPPSRRLLLRSGVRYPRDPGCSRPGSLSVSSGRRSM
jgi:hypothetical protein